MDNEQGHSEPTEAMSTEAMSTEAMSTEAMSTEAMSTEAMSLKPPPPPPDVTPPPRNAPRPRAPEPSVVVATQSASDARPLSQSRRPLTPSKLKPTVPHATPSLPPAPFEASFVPQLDDIPENAPPSLADAPPPSSDPRIISKGHGNRRVLDAIKQVKRSERTSAPLQRSPPDAETVADKLASGPLQLALRMEQNGRLEDAIRFLEHSIAKSPDAPSLYNRLAIILMRERADFRRAEALLQKAVELAPDNAVYETNLRAVLSKLALLKR
jgi:hypothetical protein